MSKVTPALRISIYALLLLCFSYGFQARAQTPKTIGHLDSKDALVFEGNQSYTKQQICKALYGDKDIIVAITPTAPLAGFMKMIEKKVKLGYLNDGFYSPEVKASYVAQPEHILISIVEGTRYKKGQLVITGASEALKEELTQCLNGMDPRVADAMGISEFRKSIQKGDLNAALTKDVYMALLWGSSRPVSFVPSFVKTSTQYLHKLLEVLGYYNSEFTIKLLTDHKERTVQLQIDFQKEGTRAHIGKINVSGNTINSDEQVLTYLDLKTGQPINNILVQSLYRKLLNSGRFRFADVTPEINSAQPLKSVLNITLIETSPATPLGQTLSENELLLRKVGEFMDSYRSWEKDLWFRADLRKDERFTETVKKYGGWVPGIFEGIYSSKQGVVFSESIDEKQTLNTIVIAPEQIWYLCPPLKQSIICSDPKGDMILQFGINPDIQRENGWDIKFGMGASTNYNSDTCSYQPMISIHPAVWFHLANDPENEITFIDDTRALIKTKRSETEVDRQTGEIIEIRSGIVKITFKKGCFDERIEKLKANLSEQNYTSTTMRTGFSTLLSSVLPLGLSHVPTDSVTLDRNIKATDAWVRMISGLAECGTSDDDVKSQFKRSFSLPKDELLAQGGMMQMMLSAVYQVCHDNLPRDSWVRTLSHVSVLIASGHARCASVPKELQELYYSEKIGSIGYLFTSHALKHLGFPGYKVFAQRGLQKMSVDDFAKDWKPLLTNDSEIKDKIRCCLESFQAHSAEDIHLVASIFTPEITSLIETAAQKIKEVETEQLQVSLAPILSDFWEKSLREVIRKQLNDLIVPQKKNVDAGKELHGAPVDKESPIGKPPR